MSSKFECLCDLLEDEIERQENVLAVCRAQSEAVKTNDLEYLEAKTAALVVLIQEAAQAARERAGLVESILKEDAGFDAEQLNRAKFADVVAATPEPLRGRLAESHARLHAVLDETRPVATANAISLRTALRTMNASLSVLAPTKPSGAAYDARGMGPVARPGAVNLVDQRG